MVAISRTQKKLASFNRAAPGKLKDKIEAAAKVCGGGKKVIELREQHKSDIGDVRRGYRCRIKAGPNN